MKKNSVFTAELVAAVALLLLAVAALWQLFPDLKSEVGAAWVQAVFSVVAIIAAIAIANQQSKIQRAEAERLDQIKAQVAAARIVQELTHILSHVRTMVGWCEQAESQWPRQVDIEAIMKNFLATTAAFGPSREDIIDLTPLPNHCAFNLAAGVSHLSLTRALAEKLVASYTVFKPDDDDYRKEVVKTMLRVMKLCANTMQVAHAESQKVTKEFIFKQ